MATLESSPPITDLHTHVAEGLCPVCDQPIPNERAAQVYARFHEFMDAKAALEKQKGPWGTTRFIDYLRVRPLKLQENKS